MAWLNTTPSKEKQTRLERMLAHGVEPILPDADALHLVEYLKEAGPGTNGTALTWQELQAWQDQTGVVLQPWEARLLRRLSKDYVHQAALSTAPDCLPPFAELPKNTNVDAMLDTFLD